MRTKGTVLPWQGTGLRRLAVRWERDQGAMRRGRWGLAPPRWAERRAGDRLDRLPACGSFFSRRASPKAARREHGAASRRWAAGARRAKAGNVKEDNNGMA